MLSDSVQVQSRILRSQTITPFVITVQFVLFAVVDLELLHFN